MRIEKRLPFGFMGDWGKLYKRYVAGDESITIEDEIIEYEGNYFRDIGQDVQFKRAEEVTKETVQPSKGALQDDEYMTVETTDAYYDNSRKEYMCIVKAGDIVKIFGRQWICKNVKTKIKHTPAEQKFFYCFLEIMTRDKPNE